MQLIADHTAAAVGTRSRRDRLALRAGRILTVLIAAFLCFDGVMHATRPPAVVAGLHSAGFPIEAALPLGIIELCCVALYVLPRTSVLGAVLLTGYLGGAVAVNVRIEAALITGSLTPVYVAVLMWGALHLRDPRLRALVPFRTR